MQSCAGASRPLNAYKQGLEPNFLKLLRMLLLVLSHTHWQAHQRDIARGVFFSRVFPSH